MYTVQQFFSFSRASAFSLWVVILMVFALLASHKHVIGWLNHWRRASLRYTQRVKFFFFLGRDSWQRSTTQHKWQGR